MKQPKGCVSNYWLNTIKIKNLKISKRDKLLKRLNKSHLECRPVWNLLHRLPMFKKSPKSKLVNSEKLEGEIITLPSSPIYGRK